MQEAINAYIAAQELDLNNPKTALCLANAYALNAEHSKAKKFFELALELGPNCYEAIVCYAVFNLEIGDTDKAILEIQ